GRIQMDRLRREEPALEFAHEPLFLLGFLDFRKATQVRMRRQLGGWRSMRPKEEKCELLESRAALGGKQTRPPVCRRKIFARKRQFLEIILEQQPRALR